MTTDVEICNMALSRVKADSIGDLSENTVEAVQCRIFYEPTRDRLLTMYSWGFAKKTRALSLTGNDPDEWQYEYDYPNDCLRVGYILPYAPANGMVVPHQDYEPVAYEIGAGTGGSRVILSNVEEAYISYTAGITDERLFDPLYVDAFAWLLAIDLAIPLGGDSGKKYRSDAMDGFRDAMGQAMAHSANEDEPGQVRMPASIRARGNVVTAHDFYEHRRP